MQMVKKLLADACDPHLALLNYRSTPLQWCNVSPCELLMGRMVRTCLPQVDKLPGSKMVIPVKLQEGRGSFQGEAEVELWQQISSLAARDKVQQYTDPFQGCMWWWTETYRGKAWISEFRFFVPWRGMRSLFLLQGLPWNMYDENFSHAQVVMRAFFSIWVYLLSIFVIALHAITMGF